jgi:hypothetical protein
VEEILAGDFHMEVKARKEKVRRAKERKVKKEKRWVQWLRV